MTKKILKIVCILILVLCTLITSKAFAATDYGAYGEKGDDIRSKKGPYTHGVKASYHESTVTDPSTGEEVTLSGRFWCMDYGSRWSTKQGDRVTIPWNYTKNIPVRKRYKGYN